MATNQGFKSFIPDPNRLSAKYLLYWLRKNRGYLESLGNGATFKEVSKAVVSRIKIPLPSLQEQLHIAGILDRTYALQAKRRETISQLELLAQSMFLDLFGDPAINAKSWPQKALGELLADAEVFVDGDWVETKDQDPSGDVRLIQLADVGDGHYVDKSARFLTQETATRLKCTFLKRNDVLVARMPDPLGRACLFPGDSREAVTVVDVCIIRPRNADPDPRWLMWCINSRGFRSLIAREVTGTTRQRISRGNLSRLPIIAPPIVDQREFSRRVDAVERVKSASQVSLIDFNALFCSLEHRAFKGEL